MIPKKQAFFIHEENTVDIYFVFSGLFLFFSMKKAEICKYGSPASKGDNYQYYFKRKNYHQTAQKGAKPKDGLTIQKTRSPSKDSLLANKDLARKKKHLEHEKTQRVRSSSNPILIIKKPLNRKSDTQTYDAIYDRCKTIITHYQVKYEKVMKANIKLKNEKENLLQENKLLRVYKQ